MKYFFFIFLLYMPYILVGQEKEKLAKIQPHLNLSITVKSEHNSDDAKTEEPKVKLHGESSIIQSRYNISHLGNGTVLIKPPTEPCQPLFIVDEVFINEYAILLKTEDIESISILKQDKPGYLSDPSCSGTIVIKTKNKLTENNILSIPEASRKNGLYVIDGIPTGNSMMLAIEDIEQIMILHDIMWYGSEEEKTATLTIELDIDRWASPDFIHKLTAFVQSQKQPDDELSEQILKHYNSTYTTEWNKRYHDTTQYPPSIYNILIDYKINKNYGYKTEYSLYLFYKFIEKEYNISLGA